MKNEALHVALEKIYSQLDTGVCKPGCHQCCGLVPYRDAERIHIENWLEEQGREPLFQIVTSPRDFETKRCPYVTSEGCSIYPVRPLLCRMMGVVDHPILTCNGGKFKRKMSAAWAERLKWQVRALDTIITMSYNFMGWYADGRKEEFDPGVIAGTETIL